MLSRVRNVLLLTALLMAVSGAAMAQPHMADYRTAPGAPPNNKAGAGMALMQCLLSLGQGQFARGEEQCDSAIALDPKDPHGYKLRGYALLLEQRYERAAMDFRDALRLGLQDGETWAGYGRSLSGQGQFAQALEPYRKAIKLEPDKAAYRAALCWAEAGTGKNLNEALAECNRALTLAPGTPAPLDARGLIYLRQGRFKASIADYDRALAISAAQPSALFGRGLARLRLNQQAAAGADFVAARKQDSDIDLLFVQLGVLPRRCLDIANAKSCPPLRPSKVRDPGRIAHAGQPPDIERLFVRELNDSLKAAPNRLASLPP